MDRTEIPTEIASIIRLIEALNREKQRHARYRAALLRLQADPSYALSVVNIPERTQHDWKMNVQPLVSEIQRRLAGLQSVIVAHWGYEMTTWETFCDMVGDGRDNWEQFNAAGWADRHIRVLRGVLASMTRQAGTERESTSYAFMHEGATWRIVYQGRAVTVKDSKGMRYIHWLMRQPGKEEESAGIEAECNRDQLQRDVRPADESLLMDEGIHAGELDLNAMDRKEIGQSVNVAKGQINEWKRELDQSSDPAKQAELHEDIDKTEQYISQNMNRLGRVRPSSPIEDSRKRVSAAIHTAKENIAASNSAIGQHFRTSIRARGTAWVYEPDRNIDWVLS